ncbi:hypothetical protein CU097_003731 [Rhizopus azygosporus]|uniref:Alpha 1,2-mannosyltransferase 2.4.1 n=1 Tax=Rhizopus azygosporus TaxID=86630 RepID=A0A367JYF6_RHIAZ|nr:hypothetical protein CU097_003731 [Rhizopus azygosporus]
MIYLQESPHPLNKTKYGYNRRQLSKTIFRATIIVLMFVICFFIGHKVQWNSLSEQFDPRDAAFIQYFCTQQEATHAVENQKAQLIVGLEHQRAGYLKPEVEPDDTIPDDVWKDLPVRGAYYMVVRNEKLNDAKAVIKSMEEQMKNGTRYPWVILNNQHFTLDFQKYIKRVTKAPVFFGKIDLHAWEYPYWVDIPRAEDMMLDQDFDEVYNKAKLSYHQLLRYHAGFFFHHPLLRDVEYTWRVEPGADYSCKIDQDLFLVMKEQGKKLGFVITMKEAPQTIPTLWTRVNEFREIYPQYVLDLNSTIYPWIYSDREDDYNYCHFWTNFQLADLSFFRSEAYQKYFEYLDKTGNFFYESLPRVKGAFVVLARNSELYALRSSMRYLEDRFNRKYNYPWIFLNEQPFTEEFKELTSMMTNAQVYYGLVPEEHWSYPEWIDQEHAAECRKDLENRGILYGGSESYRHMCRYQSGFFMLHPLLDDIDYYWRVEPGVKFSCDIDYDPFRLMQERDLKYGFTIALKEYFETIPTLWEVTRDFVQNHPQYIYPRTRKDSLLGIISDDNGWSYNLCHFWSNFEIASVKFMRSEGYQAYFKYLDEAGGFFYERWGDAPVHSIAVALMLKRSDVHWFYDIGYKHDFFEHCPTEDKWLLQSKCYCDPETTFDINPGSCTPRFLEVMNKTATSFIVTRPDKDDY